MTGCRFERISRLQVGKDMKLFLREMLLDPAITLTDKGNCLWDIYENRIRLPVRATSGSAGYDIVSPVSVRLEPGEPQIIPTGLRCLMPHGTFLMIVPRSGLGFKYGLRLMNSVGIIDEDYAFADNEGHILLKMTVDTGLDIQAGDRIAQAIFLQYGTTEDDDATTMRHGGLGSTGRA